MKAHINGVTVEGTPQEIADYQRIMDNLRRAGVYIKPPIGKTPQWVLDAMAGWNKQRECGCIIE